MSKQFNFKQLGFVKVHSLDIKIDSITNSPLKIQFSIGTLFGSIRSIDRALSGATTPSHIGPGSDEMKPCSAFSKAPALLQPNYQIV